MELMLYAYLAGDAWATFTVPGYFWWKVMNRQNPTLALGQLTGLARL